jgi:hypothetical protein
MNTRIIDPTNPRTPQEAILDIFTLQDFYTFTKGNTYLIMGAILIFMPLYWHFLTDREDD